MLQQPSEFTAAAAYYHTQVTVGRTINMQDQFRWLVFTRNSDSIELLFYNPNGIGMILRDFEVKRGKYKYIRIANRWPEIEQEHW